MVKLLDCTTRDGGYSCNWEYSDEYVLNHLDFLNKKGVSYYEIGYRNSEQTEGKGRFYRCTTDVIEPFCKNKGSLKIGVMVDIKRYNPMDFLGISEDNIDFVRIATHPEDISSALTVAQDLKRKGYSIFLQLMDITEIDANGYLYLYMFEEKEIFESLYFADSYSKLCPSEMAQYCNKFKVLGYNRISFHAHNEIGFALENTKVAVSLGAFSVDVTKDGLGRCGGNLDIESFLNSL